MQVTTPGPASAPPQRVIDACDLCDDKGRAPNGMVCHHVESAPMPEALRELIKTTKETP